MLATTIAATVVGTSPAQFSSVKLPTRIVATARAAAQPMRRSVASQIEYWVTLGLALEHNGLTSQEARQAIESYEAAVSQAQAQTHKVNAIAQLKAAMLDESQSGRLQRSVHTIVTENHAKAARTQQASVT